jgi:hypothetical protein
MDVCPLCTDALSTSFRLLPLVAAALPLRRSRAPWSFSLIADASSWCCRLGGIVDILAPTWGRIAGLEDSKRRVQWEGVRRVPPHCSRPTNAGRCGTTPQTTGINLALNDVGEESRCSHPGSALALRVRYHIRAAASPNLPSHSRSTSLFLCRPLFLSTPHVDGAPSEWEIESIAWYAMRDAS